MHVCILCLRAGKNAEIKRYPCAPKTAPTVGPWEIKITQKGLYSLQIHSLCLDHLGNHYPRKGGGGGGVPSIQICLLGWKHLGKKPKGADLVKNH